MIASIQASKLLLVPPNISIDVKAACNIVCYTITEPRELSSKVLGPWFCYGCWLFSLELHVWKTLFWNTHVGRCDETNYHAWFTPSNKCIPDHCLYAMIKMVLHDSCVCYFAIHSMCDAKHGFEMHSYLYAPFAWVLKGFEFLCSSAPGYYCIIFNLTFVWHAIVYIRNWLVLVIFMVKSFI